LLTEAQRLYHVFHLRVRQGSEGKTSSIDKQWKDLLGENVIIVEDYNNIAEIIATTVAVVRGADLQKVTSDFDHRIAGDVTKALARVSTDVAARKDGIVKL
jgi:hypothetical protein